MSWTSGFDTVISQWIDIVDRSEETWNTKGEPYVVAVVHYTNQQGYTNYNLYFWVPLAVYEALKNADSVGSHYYKYWSVYGLQLASHYAGQDDIDNNDNSDNVSAYTGNQGGELPPPVQELRQGEIPFNNTMIDGGVLREAINAQDEGRYEDWVDDYIANTKGSMTDDMTAKQDLKDWLNRVEGFEKLFERTEGLREAIQFEQLTTKGMFKTIFRDIESFLGVSLEKRLMYGILGDVGGGKLNPATFNSYKFKVKEIYDTLEADGLRGASQVGNRFINAKNPLLRNRTAYKGKEALRQIRGSGKVFEGEDAVKEIQRFHRKTLKENAQGFKRKNSYKLEQKIVQGKITYSWKRDVSFGRKIITSAKKVLKIGKWFL